MEAAPERFGSYVIYEQLGKGGMATVHRAELPQRTGAPKQIALKRLMPTYQKEIVALFLDEARLLRYLHHPNIAETYDSGKVFGTYFIAMEYVKGPTLKELVKHCGSTVGSVPQEITVNLVAQLCDALDHAHNRTDEKGAPLGIIHRDITPSNVIVSDKGALKLIDFGLAKAKVSTEETGQGIIKGKFGYVAPEYLGGKLDHRADLWAVGIIMYELLTSRRLFDGKDAFETMMRVRSLPIPRPSIGNPRVTPELDRLVMTALERNPDKRWQSAAEMRDALREVIRQPGNQIDGPHIAEWVRWVFELQPGSDISGVRHLKALSGAPDNEATIMDPLPPMPIDDDDEDDDGDVTEAEEPPRSPTPIPRPAPLPAPVAAIVGDISRAALIWYAGALAVAFVAAAAIVWALLG
ncbi:MAG TPA: serine/threonine-protein kinase [Kofleriaceae bacterium]|nr:serine/threonine-protein kinase [Kofleriaceae bacterium]